MIEPGNSALNSSDKTLSFFSRGKRLDIKIITAHKMIIVSHHTLLKGNNRSKGKIHKRRRKDKEKKGKSNCQIFRCDP